MKIITKGASVNKAFTVPEEGLTINGGNNVVPKITTNGNPLVINHLMPGATVDGSKDPADWGANGAVNDDRQMLDHLGKNYVFREWAEDELCVGMLLKAKEKKATAAYLHLITWIHDNPTGDAPTWQADYLVAATAQGWWVSVSVIKNAVQAHFGVADWGGLVALVLSKSLETWQGKSTVIVREVA
jgi:hypothetical protein